MHQLRVAYLAQTLVSNKIIWIKFNNCTKIMFLQDQIPPTEIVDHFMEIWTIPKTKEFLIFSMNLTIQVASLDHIFLEPTGFRHHHQLSTNSFSKLLRHMPILKEIMKIWMMLLHTKSMMLKLKKKVELNNYQIQTQIAMMMLEASTSQQLSLRKYLLLQRQKRRKRRRRRVEMKIWRLQDFWALQINKRTILQTLVELLKVWINKISVEFQLIHTLVPLLVHYNHLKALRL